MNNIHDVKLIKLDGKNIEERERERERERKKKMERNCLVSRLGRPLSGGERNGKSE